MTNVKAKILIAEDNPMNMRLMEMTLNNHNYTLLKANDGIEALEITQRENPDLIVMDINLPKMSGLDVTRTLRKIPAFSKTPIIGITAYAMKGDKEKILEAGCDIYLSKPINTRELPMIVAETLAKNTPRKRGGNA
jgi:two-component system, cell cycle response regulator DivK